MKPWGRSLTGVPCEDLTRSPTARCRAPQSVTGTPFRSTPTPYSSTAPARRADRWLSVTLVLGIADTRQSSLATWVQWDEPNSRPTGISLVFSDPAGEHPTPHTTAGFSATVGDSSFKPSTFQMEAHPGSLIRTENLSGDWEIDTHPAIIRFRLARRSRSLPSPGPTSSGRRQLRIPLPGAVLLAGSLILVARAAWFDLRMRPLVIRPSQSFLTTGRLRRRRTHTVNAGGVYLGGCGSAAIRYAYGSTDHGSRCRCCRRLLGGRRFTAVCYTHGARNSRCRCRCCFLYGRGPGAF